MKEYVESNWAGWNPSANDNVDPSSHAARPILLKMDNLTLDELGNLRIVRGPRLEATTQFPGNDIYDLYSAYINGKKTRFVYASYGETQKTLMCTSTTPRAFDTTLATQNEISKRCSFLNVLGQILMVAGGIQRKYDGTNNFPLGIPAPPAPSVSGATDIYLNLNNAGATMYVNWSSVQSTTFDNTKDDLIAGTAAPSTPARLANELIMHTTFTSPFDTTNFQYSGNSTDEDALAFNFTIADAAQLAWVKIELGTDSSNYFWREWDFIGEPNLIYSAFSVASGEISSPQLRRKDAYIVGTPNWKTINFIKVTIGILDITTEAKIGSFFFNRGEAPLTSGDYQYVAVQVNRANGFLEFSPASPAISVTSAGAVSFTVSPGKDSAGNILPLDSGANEWWLFRLDPNGGAYYRVTSQAGAYGFTPTTYTDTRTLAELTEDANINTYYNLQYYRTALPTDIIGMIWFRDRVMYLTKNSFIPSFKYDFGSYDSRYKYELTSKNSEEALFIAKLDVGTFIIATTADFYRVSGTFSTESYTDANGNTVYYQDVTITPLGISNPATHHAFVEYQGTILYVANDGIRVLSNGTSILVNDTLELLFRKETRYDLSPIHLEPFDQSAITVVNKGTRIYWSLPHYDGINRIYVLNIANPSDAMTLNTRSWRMMTFGDANLNPTALFREPDGTIIYASRADPLNYIFSLEDSGDYTNYTGNAYGFFPVKIKTQFNFFGSPSSRKDLLNFKAKVNTGGQIANLLVYGLTYEGEIISTTAQFSSLGDAVLELDLKSKLIPCIAYAIEISCLTNCFFLNYISLIYEERPPATRRFIQYPTNFGNPRLKKIATWPFLADLLDHNASAIVTIDGIAKTAQLFTGEDPKTYYWLNNEDLAGIDWGIEITCDDTMEFYKLHPPDILQIFPIPRLIDQIGPLDFNKHGLVYGARFRISSAGNIHYKVYDGDVLIFENDIVISPNVDDTYIESFPKGIDPSVCRIVISAPQVFYRYSVEYKVRVTGNDTEERFVKVSDPGSSSK